MPCFYAAPFQLKITEFIKGQVIFQLLIEYLCFRLFAKHFSRHTLNFVVIHYLMVAYQLCKVKEDDRMIIHSRFHRMSDRYCCIVAFVCKYFVQPWRIYECSTIIQKTLFQDFSPVTDKLACSIWASLISMKGFKLHNWKVKTNYNEGDTEGLNNYMNQLLLYIEYNNLTHMNICSIQSS
jgi:hypothetical protein